MNFDGMSRDPEADRRISEAVHLLFRGATGDTVLAYLREVCHAAVPYDAQALHFAYQEGMRYTLRLIEQRRAAGEEIAKGATVAAAKPTKAAKKQPGGTRLRNWSTPE